MINNTTDVLVFQEAKSAGYPNIQLIKKNLILNEPIAVLMNLMYETKKRKESFKMKNKELNTMNTNEAEILHSEEKKTAVRFIRRKVIAICAAAAILSTFAVTAAATNMFGLTTEKTGLYGLNVRVEDKNGATEEIKRLNLIFGYLPETYAKGQRGHSWVEYQEGDDFFTAWITSAENYEEELINVVGTSETEYDGHKTVFVTFKEAENRDNYYYSAFKYFDEENCLVRCNGSDYDELVKIAEQVSVMPAPEDQPAADANGKKWKYSERALYDYDRSGDGFRDEYFAGKVQEVSPGEEIVFSTAGYDKDPVKLTATVLSVEEYDNVSGFTQDNFLNLGMETTFGMFFEGNGDLIKEHTYTVYEGADENYLGQAIQRTDTRRFYMINIALTAEQDIDDLYDVFNTDMNIIKDNCFCGYMDEDFSRALKIYATGINDTVSLKKGETVLFQTGFIAENNVEEDTYLSLSAIDTTTSNYQNYIMKVK